MANSVIGKRMISNLIIFSIVLLSRFQCSSADYADDPREEILDRALAAIDKVSQNITESIPSFHYYIYDGHPYDMHDGGHGMYDGIGNKVYHTNGEFTDVLFDYNVGYGNYRYGVRSDNPLFGLMWITNRRREYHTYRIQIEGYPGHGKERHVVTNIGSVTLPGALLQYKAYQVYGSGIPSICEVYFTMENNEWDSRNGDEFSILTFKKNATHLKNSVILTGRPKSIMMGYMLLSNADGNIIPSEEIDEVHKVVGGALINLDNNLRNFTEEALLAVEASVGSIQASVTNWYNYTYSMQEIQNGGEDMYGRRGNQIDFNEDAEDPTHLYYAIPYKSRNYQVISLATHPFIGLMWIENNLKESHSYKWKVSGFAGKNKIAVVTTFKGSIVWSETNVQYNVFSMSGIRDHPSICEVYFSVTSKDWQSSDDHTISAMFSNDKENLNNTIVVEGKPYHVLIGYLLLSKKNATSVTKSEVTDVLKIVVEQLEKIDVASETFLDEAIQELENAAGSIVLVIDDWHNYLYDEGFYNIAYEPRDMFTPYGSSIIFEEDLDHASYNRTNYDLYYRFEDAATKCKVGHPFVCLMWMDSEKFTSYSLKVHSHVDRPGTEKYIDYSGSLEVVGTNVDYYVFQVYSKSTASICEVYFILSNPTNWSSESIDSHFGSHFDRSDVQDNYIYLIGNIRNNFMGYMLLSRYPGNVTISEEEVRNSLTLAAASITQITLCDEETLSYPYDETIMVTFPRTDAGTLTDSNEFCSDGTDNAGMAYGSRRCGDDGLWEDSSWIESCDFEIVETTSSEYQVESTTPGAGSCAQPHHWMIATISLLQLIIANQSN